MEECRRPGPRQVATIASAFALVWLVVMGAGAAAVAVDGSGDRFSILRWEVTRLTASALNRSANLVTRRVASDDELRHYFELMREAQAAAPAPNADANAPSTVQARQRAEAAVREAAGLRVLVEGRFEQALERVIRRAGLVEHLPVFSRASFVWPPVATGFSVPPHILIVSPRNRIALQDTTLLRTDLSPSAADRIERRTEAKGVSALVDQIGGLGAYPSIVDQGDTPLGLMQTIAHEWMHEYLAFHPLGARYGSSNDMTLINETVAELVGRELGSTAFDSLGLTLPTPSAGAGAGSGGSSRALNLDRTLHDLRLEVDGLLKQGKVERAEQRMNETQQQLAAQGYRIRRINQAYFAFYGSYGTNAASSSPLGAKIDTLRRESPTLQAFVHAIQDVSRPPDLDRLLQAAAR